jgi:hypothetical protein
MADTSRVVAVLAGHFQDWLDAFDHWCPFSPEQRAAHVETITRRREFGSASAALGDDDFLQMLYRTLQRWGIGLRGSNLYPFDQFATALRTRTAAITALDGLAIDQPGLDAPSVGETLARLVQSLEIVDNQTRLVPGSKALHHLLLDLVVPFDREYTQHVFGWGNPQVQYAPERRYREAFEAFVAVARRVNLRGYVGRGPWYTSPAKVIDNAVVGMWCWVKAEAARGGQRGASSHGKSEGQGGDAPARPPTEEGAHGLEER